MSALVEFVGQILFQLVFEVIGYFTGRVLLPVASFGKVRTERVSDAGPFKWHGCRRAPDGKIVANVDLTSLVGVFFWLAIIAAVIYWNWDAF